MADASSSSSPADVLSGLLATSPTLVQQKIKSLFEFLQLPPFNGIIQFWAPIKTTGGRWLLTTSNQPFFLTNNQKGAKKYRLCSVKYQYTTDMNDLQVEEDPTIINGGPTTAFLNRLPFFSLDLRVHRKSPLESCAVQCGLFNSVMLPVFYPSYSCCVGVLEYSSSLCNGILSMLKGFSYKFEREDLKIFDIPRYKTMCILQYTRDRIRGLLQMMWSKFQLDWPKFVLGVVQVWNAYKDEDHVPFSSSMKDTQTKRMVGLKLTDYHGDDSLFGYDDYAFKCFVDYTNICNEIPLKMGEGLIGQTLEDHKPRFIKKVSKLSDNQPLLMVRHSVGEGYPFECSCFVICLRNIEVGNFDFAFEFIWHELPNYAILLESLLLLLKKCLPNFKYAFGGEIGDELRIIDVENSTKSKIKYFTIFKGNKSSSATEALEKRSRVVKECSTPLKRKRKDGSDTNEEDKEAFQDPLANNKEMYLEESTLTIKAEYADDMIKFHLPISSATFADILKEVGERFKLNPANYKLKYLDGDGDWILMNSDKDVKVCIKDLRNSTSIVRLRLLPTHNI